MKREQTAHILLAVENPRQKTIELKNCWFYQPDSFSTATQWEALQSDKEIFAISILLFYL